MTNMDRCIQYDESCDYVSFMSSRGKGGNTLYQLKRFKKRLEDDGEMEAALGTVLTRAEQKIEFAMSLSPKAINDLGRQDRVARAAFMAGLGLQLPVPVQEVLVRDAIASAKDRFDENFAAMVLPWKDSEAEDSQAMVDDAEFNARAATISTMSCDIDDRAALCLDVLIMSHFVPALASGAAGVKKIEDLVLCLLAPLKQQVTRGVTAAGMQHFMELLQSLLVLREPDAVKAAAICGMSVVLNALSPNSCNSKHRSLGLFVSAVEQSDAWTPLLSAVRRTAVT